MHKVGVLSTILDRRKQLGLRSDIISDDYGEGGLQTFVEESWGEDWG